MITSRPDPAVDRSGAPADAPAPRVEVVFEPGGGLGRHRRRLAEMRRDLARSPELVRRLLVRELRGEYRQTLLGGLLAFLPALGLVLWAVLADRARLIATGDLEIPYPAWVLTGTVLWHTFAESIQIQLETLLTERGTLAKLDLPPEGPILAAVARIVVHLVPKLALLAIVFALFGIAPRPSQLLAPLPLVAMIAFGTALGLVLAPLNALYRDVGKALQPILTLWLLLTPVFYPVPRGGALATLLSWNPVTPLLQAGRDLLTIGAPASPWAALALGGAALVALPLAWFFYRLALPTVLERTA